MAEGRWGAAYAGAAAIEVPDELAAALAAEPRARVMFGILTAQNRYAVLYRVTDAKRADTRARRIERLVAMFARGETPIHSAEAGGTSLAARAVVVCSVPAPLDRGMSALGPFAG